MTFNSRIFVSVLGCGLVLVASPDLFAKKPPAPAQQQDQAASAQDQDQDQDALKRQRTPEETYKARKELRQELKDT